MSGIYRSPQCRLQPAALWVVDSLSSVATGTITDHCIRRGASPTMARKWAMAVGFTLAAVSLVGCAFAGEHTYLACLIACAVGSGTANAGTFAFAQTLAGPHAAGRWVGLQNGIANMAGSHWSRTDRLPRGLDWPLRRGICRCRRHHVRRGVCVVSRRYPSSAGRLHLISR